MHASAQMYLQKRRQKREAARARIQQHVFAPFEKMLSAESLQPGMADIYEAMDVHTPVWLRETFNQFSNAFERYVSHRLGDATTRRARNIIEKSCVQIRVFKRVTIKLSRSYRRMMQAEENVNDLKSDSEKGSDSDSDRKQYEKLHTVTARAWGENFDDVRMCWKWGEYKKEFEGSDETGTGFGRLALVFRIETITPKGEEAQQTEILRSMVEGKEFALVYFFDEVGYMSVTRSVSVDSQRLHASTSMYGSRAAFLSIERCKKQRFFRNLCLRNAHIPSTRNQQSIKFIILPSG